MSRDVNAKEHVIAPRKQLLRVIDVCVVLKMLCLGDKMAEAVDFP